MSGAWCRRAAFICIIGFSACAPGGGPEGMSNAADDAGVTAPWRHWQPGDGAVRGEKNLVGSANAPEAVILALHGFNDYSNAFQDFAAYSKERNIAVHAYDQRGFGANPDRGRWPGMDRLAGDLERAVTRVRRIYGDIPLYVLGESMGGAVAIVAATGDDGLDIDGLILSAPAVWGGPHMNVFYRLTLWITSTVAPGWTLTGSGLDIKPSDNIEMLRAFSADPLVVKATRTDAIAGLVELMDRALASASKLDNELLLLIGEKDEIVPLGALDDFQSRLDGDDVTAINYPDGYHMLLRDLQRTKVFEDILNWVRRHPASEFSGSTKVSGEARAPAETKAFENKP